MQRVTSWLIDVTRPVLSPLVGSVIFRHLYFAAHLALVGIGAWAVASLVAGESLPVVWLILALVGLTLAKGLFNYLEHFLGHLVAFKALEILRVELYRRLVPQATEMKATSGDVLNRATKDIDRIEVFFAHTLPPAITAATIPLVTVLASLPFVGFQPVLVAAVGLVLSVGVVPVLGARTSMRVARKSAAQRGELTQHVTDSLQGMSEVTGYGHVTRRLQGQHAIDARLQATEAPRSRWSGAREVGAVLVDAGTVLAVALVGAAVGVEPVALAVFAVLVWALFSVTEGVRGFAAVLDDSMAAAERVYELTHARPAVSEPESPVAVPSGPLGVEFHGVTHSYSAGSTSVQDVTVRIAPGSHTCFIGTSGSGKSTALSLIARHHDPTAGHVSLGGVDLRELKLSDVRSAVLFVEQQATLFNGTVRSNLALAAPKAGDDEMHHALEVVSLDRELAERDGLDTEVGEGAQLLSGGQRQRLALARAVLLRPRVLLLDEYTSHLDDATASQVRHNVRAEFPGITLIESTHTPAGIADADQVIVLDNGIVRAAGTPDEVADSGPLSRLMARAAELPD
ncbi:hypothetical protein C3B44_00755 [Corynebacterium yudongzhengii]|uniref:ABC transporter ATP-binding protein n=1 Tax=Corynebacterium yudongzhengii TaxID=2080740 RepID=A0A2U1T5L3_9CORY|nr:ABC transporter ATP-binding protein [Corynebacterium yudongzhengii]AWB81051.1 hypothetical protein C3B44_00755 [Corynebacterium yudongzhengii]PWC01296.1 ABC transporter ATP-binding protein [Corynebacterium yudongzhengii]